MSAKKVIKIGEPVLRETATLVTNFSDSFLNILIEDLKDTLKDGELIGIAAPQIGESLAVFVSEIRETPTRQGVSDALRVYINPKITEVSHETASDWEGCGSVPDLFGKVERPISVNLQYQNLLGEQCELKCSGLLGRVVQHEIDHLNGIMFTDLADPKSFVNREYYIKHIKV